MFGINIIPLEFKDTHSMFTTFLWCLNLELVSIIFISFLDEKCMQIFNMNLMQVLLIMELQIYTLHGGPHILKRFAAIIEWGLQLSLLTEDNLLSMCSRQINLSSGSILRCPINNRFLFENRTQTKFEFSRRVSSWKGSKCNILSCVHF